MARGGRITIDVRSPYPCWCEISIEDMPHTLLIHHNELSDLEYAVKKAMQEARLKLKDDAEEV